MSSKPMRHWLQIRLSTAVVLMLTAGVLLWANVHHQWYSTGKSIIKADEFQFAGFFRGWPFIMQAEPEFLESAESVPLQPQWLALNALVSIAILAVVAFAFEYFIHRRQARKT
jgi:hypothetical protein